LARKKFDGETSAEATVVIPARSRLGGVMVSVLAIGPFSNPAEVMDF
jgi:hypothetical protein